MNGVASRYIISAIMDALDPAAEWLRLSERYRQMSDNELLALVVHSSELTEVAQQTLANEISQRGLKLQPEEQPAPPPPAEPPPDSASSYDEDRKLVEICTVWSSSDALQLQTLLDRAGIPFFMGREKATGIDAVTSNFVNGVSVKIMQIGVPWARQAMQNYIPANGPRKQDEDTDLSVRCPRCHSTQIVFERLIAEPTSETDDSVPKFAWTCDACGHQWEDEGIAEE
jgi:DNA-directed RNA polymerase subunit M/transcription elongation factor TFIIS